MCHSREWERDMDVDVDVGGKDDGPIGCARWNACMNVGDNKNVLMVVKGTRWVGELTVNDLMLREGRNNVWRDACRLG